MPVPSRRSVPADAAADAESGSEPARDGQHGREDDAARVPARSRTPRRGPDGRLAEPSVEAADAAAPKPARRGRRKAVESESADADAAQGDAEGAGDKPAKAGKEKAAKAAPKLVKTADKLAKLGLTRSIDLVLHLPMRYEDETTLTPIGELLPGGIAQTEGVVFDNEVAYRPRRQLLVRLRDDDGSELVLRFLNFYGSQVKQMAVGQRLRVRGDVRGGFFGMEMVHPAVRVVDEDAPLPQVLTPVYPSTAGVSQAYLRKAIDNALARTPLPELLPAEIEAAYLRPLGVPALADAVRQLHHPGVDSDEPALIDGTHPAWTRIKFDELLAQQLSLKRAHEERRTRAAPAMPRRAARRPGFAGGAPVRGTAVLADRRAGARGRRDRARPHARASDAAPAAGRRGQRQDRGRRAGRRAGHRRRLPGRADGAHRNPRRAACAQAARLAGAARRRRWPGWPAASRRRRSARRSRPPRSAPRSS